MGHGFMKKVFLRAAAALLILAFTLCGCSAKVTRKTVPKEMQKFGKMSDSRLIGKLENYVLFSDSKNPRNYNCLDFYLCIVNGSEYRFLNVKPFCIVYCISEKRKW
jgi:hypothetical protein